jgi:hypothetical protein
MLSISPNIFGGEEANIFYVTKIFYRKIFSDKIHRWPIFRHKRSRWVYEGSAAHVKIKVFRLFWAHLV